MNGTSILPLLDPRPGGTSSIMPVDMAMRICLASSPPLHSFLSSYDNRCSSAVLLPHCRPLRPCLSSRRCSDVAGSSNSVTTATTTLTVVAAESNSCSDNQARLRRKTKKSVVFADSQGLALTTIHVFNEAEDDLLTEPQLHLTEVEGGAAGLHLGDVTDSADPGFVFVLDFTPPAADYLDLRNRLKAQQVCLETCSVQERMLSGTVQVRNICFEKAITIRITFDSWRSFRNVRCQYLKNIYGCPDTDTFSFSVSVPEVLEPSNKVEFCIQYETKDQTFWDNNFGNNYQLVVADPNGCLSQSTERPPGVGVPLGGDKRNEMEFDPFGSPRTSAGIFPEWQSWGCVDNSAPYW